VKAYIGREGTLNMSYTQSNPEKLTLKVHNNEDIKCGNLEMTL
jgi:hypothetical protein